MLDFWIIERLREQEKEQQRPELRIEIDPPPLSDVVTEESPEEEQRGVIIIDLLGE
jgi:hypothetical protein